MTTSLNDWYGITLNTSKESAGSALWVAKGDIYRRDNNEPVEAVSGSGATTALAEQDAKKVAYNLAVITVKPIHWHTIL